MKFDAVLNSLRRASLRCAALLALVVAIGFAASNGYFMPAENSLREASLSLSPKRASGQLHVIEMDAASIEAIREWPWSREHYARIVDRLDAAGVRSIGFDVDFSSQSNEAADARFAEAVVNSSAQVILPTFAQNSSFRSARVLDSLPIEQLRQHAQLASVSIAPDPDGLIRRMPLGTITSNVPRPSLSAFLAGQSGKVDESFPIDYSISAGTIPRHSFIDIERGAFDPGELRGRDVLIGATAIEMGDRYATPNNGVIPGVIIQALAAETLHRGRPAYGSWVLPLLIASLIGIAIMASRSFKTVVLRVASAGTLTLIASHYSQQKFLIWFDVVPALFLLVLSGSLVSLTIARRRVSKARRTNEETGLPNEVALQSHLSNVAVRHVIAARIDEFDAIKAILEPNELRLLLLRVVERLEAVSGKPVVCRTNDRVLAWGCQLNLDEIEELLAGIQLVMRSPFEIASRRVDVALTFGVAKNGAERTIANATHAADEAHRNSEFWRLHEEDRAVQLERRLSLMGELDDAVQAGHIKVYYQPKLDLSADKVTCAEALVRWKHPIKGLLKPDSFIPMAEETGRIEEVTLFVIRKTIEDLRGWCAEGITLGAAINISARLLSVPSFVSRAEHLIENFGVPHNRLTFEVTESTEFEDTDMSIDALERFKLLGIAISMDDYGTGQSTLSYIKTLPLSELKIDRSFVQHAHIDRSDAMLVRSTIQLAHELGLSVVAEGVETAECLEFLRSNGCDYAQGYFIGKPMTSEDLARSVKEPTKIAA